MFKRFKSFLHLLGTVDIILTYQKSIFVHKRSLAMTPRGVSRTAHGL